MAIPSLLKKSLDGTSEKLPSQVSRRKKPAQPSRVGVASTLYNEMNDDSYMADELFAEMDRELAIAVAEE